MDHITVRDILLEDSPVDTKTIQAVALETHTKLSGPLPRYEEIVAMSRTLCGMLRVLIDDLEQVPMRLSAVDEASYWLDMPLGTGLQSAKDITAHQANSATVLCRLYDVMGGAR